jgi:hypothetical protein
VSKVSNKTREVRNIERGAQIDFESDKAVQMFGIDRETSRRLVQDLAKGRRVWGLQAVARDCSGNDSPAEAYNAAVGSGEIGGWPLDPELYREDGTVIGEGAAANSNGNGHTEGIVNGVDIRGMVPGAIPMVKIQPPKTENIPPQLNLP